MVGVFIAFDHLPDAGKVIVWTSLTDMEKYASIWFNSLTVIIG
jgi:hypothetical protein